MTKRVDKSIMVCLPFDDPFSNPLHFSFYTRSNKPKVQYHLPITTFDLCKFPSFTLNDARLPSASKLRSNITIKANHKKNKSCHNFANNIKINTKSKDYEKNLKFHSLLGMNSNHFKKIDNKKAGMEIKNAKIRNIRIRSKIKRRDSINSENGNKIFKITTSSDNSFSDTQNSSINEENMKACYYKNLEEDPIHEAEIEESPQKSKGFY